MAKNWQKRPYTYYRCTRRRAGYPRCAAPAPSEAQVTADVAAHLERVHLGPALTAWTREWLGWWIDRERGDLAAGVAAARSELQRLEARKRRLTELVIAGTLSEIDFEEHRTDVENKIALTRARLEDPVAALDAWHAAVTEIVDVGSTVRDAFGKSTPDERRGILTRMYENFVVTDRKTAPILRAPFISLAEEHPDEEALSRCDENHVRAAILPPNKRKNARPRTSLERACLAWWTLRGSNS